MPINEPNGKRPSDKKTPPFKGRNESFSKRSEDFFAYARSNKEQTIAYVLLILGLLFFLFFNALVGELLIGGVAGYYFAPEIVSYIQSLGQILGGQNQLRYAILAVLVLVLIFAAPGIFIGALVVAAFKQVFRGPK